MYIYICIYTYVYIYMYKYKYKYKYKYIYIYTYIHIHIYIYIHRQLDSVRWVGYSPPTKWDFPLTWLEFYHQHGLPSVLSGLRDYSWLLLKIENAIGMEGKMIETISFYTGPTLTFHRSDSKKTGVRYLRVILHAVTTLSQATFASSSARYVGDSLDGWLCPKTLGTHTHLAKWLMNSSRGVILQ